MIGVKKNGDKWQAKLGKKVLGDFETKEEAMDCYDEYVTNLFAYPVTNKKKDETDTTNK